MMKKFIVVISLLLIMGMLAVPAFAAQTATVSVTASDTAVSAGDTIVVTVSVSQLDNCASGGFMFSYNTEVFEYLEGKALVSGYTMAGVSTQAGNLSGFFAAGNGTVSGGVFQITLKVKDTAAVGNYAITGEPNFTADGENVTCSVSGVSVSVVCDHEYTYMKVDDEKHSYSCAKCGDQGEENHKWDNGTGLQSPSCTAPGEVTYTCMSCQATKKQILAQEEHSYDSPCDDTCNNCQAVRPVTHSYKNTWSQNGTNHWHECSICGYKKDLAAHIPGPAATSTTPQVCTVCNYQIAPAVTHQHTMDYSEWVGDEYEHWHRCTQSCSYREHLETHEYDSGCDVECNVCGYIRVAPHKYRQEWESSVEGHWQVCIDCFALSEPVPHVPGPEATETEPQVCLECGFFIELELSHEHDFGELWYCDDKVHWQSCSDPRCFENTTSEPHNWNDGTVLENGDTEYQCQTCGKKQTIAGNTPNPPATEPTQPATAPATKPAKKDDGSNGFPWEWAGIAAIVLLVIGIVLLVIEFIRSRKSNHHGKYSK